MVKPTFSILERNLDLIEYLEFNDDFVFTYFGSETLILEKLFLNYQIFM